MKHILLLLSIILLAASCSSEFDGISPKEYVEKNNLDARELDEGVFIVVKEQGNDIQAELDDVIVVDFVGRLAKNEQIFSQGDDFQAILGNLIAGWYIGLREIGEGGSCTLVVPPSVAYGSNTIPGVPGNSVLVFDLDLKQILKPTTVEGYIDRNNLITKELDKGVHIVIKNEGGNIKPKASNNITVNYVGKFTNEFQFDGGDVVKFKLSDLIEGWQIGLPEIGEGGSCILILPSEVAYGSEGNAVVPPDQPLVFEIDLLDVELSILEEYIVENELVTEELEEGVHIIIHDPGNETKPMDGDLVNVTYEGRLTTDDVFESFADEDIDIDSMVEGLKIGMKRLGIGGKCTLLVPPAAGYGSTGANGVPGNALLIYEIELKGIN